MKRLAVFLLVLTGIQFFACAPEVIPVEKPPSQESRNLEPRAPSGATWEMEWGKTLSGAKKEGKVVVYTSWSPAERDAIVKGFKEKAPDITLEVVTGRGIEIAVKLHSEKRAGLHLADLFVGGSTTSLINLKPAGLAEILQPQFVLPQVSDPKQWWGDEFPFLDPEKQVFRAQINLGGAGDTININTTMINKEDIKSDKDLLNPKWKGKIGIEDPTIGGMQYRFIVGYELGGADYWKELAKNLGAITRDKRQIAEWVSKGKYPITISGAADIIREYKQVGAPIESLPFAIGGPHISGQRSNILLLRDRPHHASTRVFLNWLLSKDIQEAWAIATEVQSGRKDVSPKHLPAYAVYQPGINYLNIDSGKYVEERENYARLAQEIFSDFLKR